MREDGLRDERTPFGDELVAPAAGQFRRFVRVLPHRVGPAELLHLVGVDELGPWRVVLEEVVVEAGLAGTVDAGDKVKDRRSIRMCHPVVRPYLTVSFPSSSSPTMGWPPRSSSRS